MTTFEWKPQHSVSVSRFDNEHKQLFALANTLDTAMRAGRGKDVLAKLLTELVTYTQTHFAAEEDLLARHGYPELAQHHTEHVQLTAKLKEFHKQFLAGEVLLTIEIMDFVYRWISNHILQTDVRYGNFLNRAGVY